MRTKIIATIGPATLDPKIFNSTIEAKVSYIRINTSYGNYKQYDQILENLKNCGKKEIQVIFDIKKLDVLHYFKKNKLKYLAVSFAESEKQLIEIRQLAPEAFIISKIESVPGVNNFNEILENSDGIMIARGDLGEAVTLEKIPCLQKKFTKITEKANKFTIAATEMLLSMVDNPSPTRAEVSDVANAVFDGVDAVMLSEETAIGNFPVESVNYMRKIIEEAESCTWD